MNERLGQANRTYTKACDQHVQPGMQVTGPTVFRKLVEPKTKVKAR